MVKFNMNELLNDQSKNKDQKEAQQLSEVINPLNNSLYSFNQTEYHSDIYAKVGTILNELKNKSIGNILNASIHQLNSLLSNKINRNYTGNELRLSYMLLYQQDITKKINFKSGAHYQFNFRKEQLYDVFSSISPKIVQNQLGIFLR